MKAFRICGCLVLMILALNGCGAASDISDTGTISGDTPEQSDPVPGDSDTVDYNGQLRLIAGQAAVWMGDTEWVAEPFFYAVTDLDRNGRLEIIQSSCQGTGLYTYSKLWEVGADGTTLAPCRFSVAEGDSQPDIITNPAAVYFDEEDNRYLYIFYDDIRNGAAEHVQSLIAFSLQNGTVTTTLLAQSHSVYGSDPETTYTDADGNAMDEAAYNVAADRIYDGLTTMEATIGWTDASVSAQLAELTEPEVMGVLEASWSGFSLA